MEGILLSSAALIGTFLAARRSLAFGVGALMAVGYFYGILRANFPDGYSHFMFDASVAGLYLGHFLGRHGPDIRTRSRHAVLWLKVLSVVPLLLFLVPLQHPLVQLVGLRAAIYFLPILVVGARMRESDLGALARWIAVLSLVAIVLGVAEFFFGVQRFYPINPVTELIYRSTDVGEEASLRIPGVFTSAHAFGGTMLAILPLLLARWAALAHGSFERRFMLLAAGASVVGIFMCGARSPVVLLVLFGLLTVLLGGLTVRRKIALTVLAVGVAVVVSSSERFRRFATLSDVDYVERRLTGSANLGLLDTVLEYPLGAGLARAAGTSLPFFLADMGLPQIGLENEYGRIVVEQGLPGLAVWFTFIGWTLWRSPRSSSLGWIGFRAIRSYVAIAWGTAFLGTGMLTSIPSTAFLLLYMGALAAEPVTRSEPRAAVFVSTKEGAMTRRADVVR